MTTAVIAPSGFQSHPGLGWNGRNAGTAGFSAMSSDESSRMFMPPRKTVQRSNSSSSLASTSSTSSTSTVTQSDVAASGQPNGESANTGIKKKTRGGFWPASKAESTSGVSTARASGAVQTNPTAVNGLGKSALPQSQAASNGVRTNNGQVGAIEQTAILALLPMNGTFERKQINVPFFTDVLKIGRQTNAKTVPTQTNGFFDSKVLSRQHAEIWADRGTGKIWIRDVKSSNGTFVNGQRLSLENRESEPHELRQHDTLELGIDIVSEDQKTIVHHKVSAKVEFAGLPGTSSNVLDLSFGDLDPSHGSSMSTPMAMSRSRPGGPPNGRLSTSSSVANSQMSSVAQQRQVNFWGTPLNVEQLVKHLATEMRAAKQQAQDLEHANSFLNSMIVTDGSTSKVQPPPADLSQARPPSIRSREARPSHASQFGGPPAPPPQQPLPEKPDSARSSPINAVSPEKLLKRSETAKPVNGFSHSPTGSSNSQILSLVQALDAAKKDLDVQSKRVQELEDMVKRERSAREAAEEKARRMQDSAAARPVTAVAAEEPVANNEIPVTVVPASSQDPTAQSQIELLQRRLDEALADRQKMKAEMKEVVNRADTAEHDAASARTSLAEMIEQLQKESKQTASTSVDPQAEIEPMITSTTEADQKSLASIDAAQLKQHSRSLANGHIRNPSLLSQQFEKAMSTVMRDRHSGSGEITAQSAPYVSMLGVVLIGVGLMAYLNSLQKGEK